MKAITSGVIALFAAILTTIVILDGGISAAIFFIGALFILILAGCYYFRISSYSVTDDGIVIRRPFDMVVLKRDGLTDVCRIDGKSLRYSVRTFGIGGLFAITGKFWNRRYGDMTWYVTRTDRVVVLVFGQKKVLLSPDLPGEFLAALKD